MKFEYKRKLQKNLNNMLYKYKIHNYQDNVRWRCEISRVEKQKKK